MPNTKQVSFHVTKEEAILIGECWILPELIRLVPELKHLRKP